jgi:hypothetical protein
MDNHLKTISASGGELIVGNYMVLFGGPRPRRRVLHQEHALSTATTPTWACSTWTSSTGATRTALGIDDSNILGVVDWKSQDGRSTRESSFIACLNRRAKYNNFLSESDRRGR